MSTTSRLVLLLAFMVVLSPIGLNIAANIIINYKDDEKKQTKEIEQYVDQQIEQQLNKGEREMTALEEFWLGVVDYYVNEDGILVTVIAVSTIINLSLSITALNSALKK